MVRIDAAERFFALRGANLGRLLGGAIQDLAFCVSLCLKFDASLFGALHGGFLIDAG
jgi:hypothetical protein